MGLLETFLSVTILIRFSSLLPIHALLLSDFLVVALFVYGSCLYGANDRSTLRSIDVCGSTLQHTRIQNNFLKCCFRVTLCEYTIPSVKRPLICFIHVSANARKKVSPLSPVSALASALKIKQALRGAKSNDHDI